MSGKGIIFNIQRYSIHDGPGIRTVVFLKGCPLKCKWCANPEGIMSYPQLSWSYKKCINCGACVETCLVGAAYLNSNKEKLVSWDSKKCIGCGNCVETCPVNARLLYGREITVKQLLKEILKDMTFYVTSGGGVTISGGEPLMQIDFLKSILTECKDNGISTAIETSGYAEWKKIKEISLLTDLIFFDVKLYNSNQHIKYTGKPNGIILSNLNKLSSFYHNIIIRIPLIPRVNDNQENIESIARFVCNLRTIKTIELLPFHRLGVYKYEQLGIDYELKAIEPLPSLNYLHLKKTVESLGLECILL